ncbi:hypothetical protein ACJJTC_000740 [Scirpophaga incertulas]
MKLTWRCMFGPQLFKIYKDGPLEAMYQPQGLEKWCDKVISTTQILYNILLYTSPIVGTYIYRRGIFEHDECKFLIRSIGGLSCIFVLSFITRGFVRVRKQQYVELITALHRSDRETMLPIIRRFDFDFRSWPATFSADARLALPWYRHNPFSTTSNPDLTGYRRTGIQLLAFIAVHTFGLRLIYPGCVGLVNYLLSSHMFQGRAYLVEEFNGQRAKIRAADGNEIDTMFVDHRRIETNEKGKTLIICCEGNSGFYEIGIMTTPAKAGFSVLGWNHPGFGGSTGYPYPEQENNAIDVVMQYAIYQLGFDPKNIVLYGWSIGGYSATWAATKYPDLQGLILDATFDDILPLAVNQMPASWALLVREVIRCYVNLNIGDLLCQYSGPVQLIRRLEDEIICLRPGVISTNCGNNLLLRLAVKRHPSLLTNGYEDLQRFVVLTERSREMESHTSGNDIHRRALQVISVYLRDIKATHCTPLSVIQFEYVMTKLARTNGRFMEQL